MTDTPKLNARSAPAGAGVDEREKRAGLSDSARAIMHEYRGTLKMLADYDSGLIDRDGNPIAKQKHAAK